MRYPNLLLMFVLVATVIGCGESADPAGTPTYYGEAKAIIDTRCATCHQAGDIGPFPLTTYEEVSAVTVPVIRASIANGTMPPWQPSDDCNTFRGNIDLAPDEKGVLLAWLDGGAPEGDPADEPESSTSEETAPFAVDMSLRLPEPYTPTIEPDDHRCQLIPWPATETRFVTGSRVTPDQRSIVHHVIIFVVGPEQVAQYQAYDDAEEGPAVLADVRSRAGIPINALLAIPVFRDYDLVNVVVFGVSNGNGGIEIWTRDERDELAISGSWYEGLSSFEFISQYVRFPKGAGVPGACWKDGRPRIVPCPAEAPGFIRSFDKDPAHLADCIGLPIGRDYGFAGSIILLLSDESKPFARNFSLWQCESSAPSESDPDPTIKFSGSSSNASDFDPAWCQQICDKVAKERGTVVLNAETGNLPDGFQFGVVIPFFAKESINDLAVLLY